MKKKQENSSQKNVNKSVVHLQKWWLQLLASLYCVSLYLLYVERWSGKKKNNQQACGSPECSKQLSRHTSIVPVLTISHTETRAPADTSECMNEDDCLSWCVCTVTKGFQKKEGVRGEMRSTQKESQWEMRAPSTPWIKGLIRTT